MACRTELARRVKTDIWNCDPHTPCQRGGNENTSGLPRRIMPEGTDLSGVSRTWRNDMAWLLTARPGKSLGWRTPAEAMAEEIVAIKSSVAAET